MDLPGFKRIAQDGKRVFYTTLPGLEGSAPRKLYNAAQVEDFLASQKSKGVFHSVTRKDFNFSKCAGPKRSVPGIHHEETQPKVSRPGNQTDELNQESTNASPIFTTENLVKAGVKLNMKASLEETAAKLDNLRLDEEDKTSRINQNVELNVSLQNEETISGLVNALSFDEGSCQKKSYL